MKRTLTIALAGVALAATLTYVAARSRQPEPAAVAAAEAVPVYQILTPYYDRGPRIIHVPQPGEDRASVPADHAPEFADDEPDELTSPPRPAKPRNVTPRHITAPQTRKETPKPRRDLSKTAPLERRTVLSAPSDDTSLTPIRPTPRFTAKPPRNELYAPPPPPAGAAPPGSEAPAPAAPESDTADAQ